MAQLVSVHDVDFALCRSASPSRRVAHRQATIWSAHSNADGFLEDSNGLRTLDGREVIHYSQ